MKPIGVVLPFRDGGTGRSEQLVEALASWKKQTEGLSDIYVITDADDPVTHPALLEGCGDVNWLEVPAGLTLMEKINYYALEIADKHEYIQFLAHDIVLRTPWESAFIDALEDFSVGMVYGDDLVHNGRLATHPCIRSSMIKAVGFYGCPAVEHNFFDNYWMSVGQAFGVCLYLPEVVMEHNHPIVNKAKGDSISERIFSLLESDQRKFSQYMQLRFNTDIQKLKGTYVPVTRRVIDCFPFFDEFMLLDIRLQELGDLVDKFVIVESKQTFTGIEKPLYLSEVVANKYAKYADKIEIIVPEVTGDVYEDAWAREKYQKNHINKAALRHLNLSDDDILLVGDADEFPRREIVKSLVEAWDGKKSAFEHSFYYYKFNYRLAHKWYQAKCVAYGDFVDFWTTRYDSPDLAIVNNAGWHFSYMKTPEKISEKIKSFSHQEHNFEEYTDPEKIAERINKVVDPFDRPDHILTEVAIDDSFPEYIKENLNNLIKEGWVAR